MVKRLNMRKANRNDMKEEMGYPAKFNEFEDRPKKIEKKQPGKRLLSAIHFALEKTGSQLRKGRNIPYITHPLGVMDILLKQKQNLEEYHCTNENPITDDLVIAAVLHDLIEDSGVKKPEIEMTFGKKVAFYVSQVTKPREGTWKAKRKIILDRMKKADKTTQLLFLADKYHNLKSTIEDREFDLEEPFDNDAEQKWFHMECLKVLVGLKGFLLYELFWNLVQETFTEPDRWVPCNLGDWSPDEN